PGERIRVRVPVADPDRDDDAADHHQYHHHSHQYHDTHDDQRAAATDPDHRRSDRHPDTNGRRHWLTAIPQRSPAAASKPEPSSAEEGGAEEGAAHPQQVQPDAGEDRAEDEHRPGQEAAADQAELEGGAEEQAGTAAEQA